MSPVPIDSTWVICYDIVSDRRRTRVAHTLEAWGGRLQASVFTARLAPDQVELLELTLAGLIDHACDRVSFFRVCGACAGERRGLGLDACEELPGHQSAIVI